jgi:hypothetical protein
MRPTDIDPTLAFTALLELDTKQRERTSAEGSAVRAKLLAAYYDQDAIRNLWDFTRWYLSNQDDSEQPTPPYRMVGEYIGTLRHIIDLKEQARMLEAMALVLWVELHDRYGASDEQLAGYERLAEDGPR